jgi:PDZ-binding kinase
LKCSNDGLNILKSEETRKIKNSRKMQKPEKTPLKLFQKRNLIEVGTPLKIPASPMMKKLGYGTGIAVYLLPNTKKQQKGQKGTSPWAIKKCLKDKVANNKTYSKRLAEEAEILRSLSHPNIVGFRAYTQGVDGR